MRTLSWICASLLVLGVAGCKSEKKVSEVFDGSKHFFVVFEEKLDVQASKVFSKGFEIGEIVAVRLGEDNMVVMELKVPKEHCPLFKKNVVLYQDDGKLTYATVGGSDQELENGGKLLGFPGKTSYYWFKTKNTLKAFSEEAAEQASKLYEKATKGKPETGDNMPSVPQPELSPKTHSPTTT